MKRTLVNNHYENETKISSKMALGALLVGCRGGLVRPGRCPRNLGHELRRLSRKRRQGQTMMGRKLSIRDMTDPASPGLLHRCGRHQGHQGRRHRKRHAEDEGIRRANSAMPRSRRWSPTSVRSSRPAERIFNPDQWGEEKPDALKDSPHAAGGTHLSAPPAQAAL